MRIQYLFEHAAERFLGRPLQPNEDYSDEEYTDIESELRKLQLNLTLVWKLQWQPQDVQPQSASIDVIFSFVVAGPELHIVYLLILCTNTIILNLYRFAKR